MTSTPNIVYLHSHDTGRCISPYGHNARTPNLQRFAEEGIVFRQCFTANPTCSPSRAALLTGEYAHSCGMYGLAHRGFEMPDYSKHITHTLKSAGYESFLLGMQHIIPENNVENIGYDQILPFKSKNIEDLTAPANEFFQSRRADNKPFFISIGTNETHRAFPPHAPEDNPDYTKAPAWLPDTPETREDMADFNTSANNYDQGVGKILKSLEDTGLADNTLVIITTDHGIAFPRAKCNMYDPGIGVLLMMRGPKGFSGGKVINSMVSHVDVFPTICEYLGIPAPERLQGVSFMPLIDGKAESVRNEVFAEVNYHAAYEPWRCVRTERYKYGRRWLKRETPVMPNCDNGHSKTLWMKYSWQNSALCKEELYDMVFDPNETNNLIDNEDMSSVLEDLRGRLDRWMRETNDPALFGMPGAHCVPQAIVTDSSGTSPEKPISSTEDKEFCLKNEIPLP